MNKIILLGRLTRDPEMRYTQKGNAMVRFTLAVNRKFFANKEEQQADFFSIIVWNKLAETCNTYLKKGNQVLIEGKIQVSNYEAKDGTKRNRTDIIAEEIEFVGSKSNGNSSAPAIAKTFGSEVPFDQEIPF